MKVPSTIRLACRLLKERVRYEDADLKLTGTVYPDLETARIRDATRIYTELWILPILDAIERGDMRELREMI